ncbi:hypothetical protein J41TS12_10990 [Paenibacillus antibioticophila]|uniref:Uncharacterized protein n=1 Tax=Paenibacillus antibioticophila TaxID=1274374 RepID=A0A920CFX8_9BACL|nr:hypothetical protein [Paenibacillus antibioticophila]GIO36238.1 hypothetical protein J41TS12_10990 [Paenibacillus antibioticophila]
MTQEANEQGATKELIEFLRSKNEEAKKAGIEQQARFIMSVSYTLGSLIGFDLEPEEYVPMIGSVMESITGGVQSAATHKGVKATFIKVVRD